MSIWIEAINMWDPRSFDGEAGGLMGGICRVRFLRLHTKLNHRNTTDHGAFTKDKEGTDDHFCVLIFTLVCWGVFHKTYQMLRSKSVKHPVLVQWWNKAGTVSFKSGVCGKSLPDRFDCVAPCQWSPSASWTFPASFAPSSSPVVGQGVAKKQKETHVITR